MRPKYDYEDRQKEIKRSISKSGRVYALMANGMIRRLAPLERWKNKSERRQVIRERRADRLQAEMDV